MNKIGSEQHFDVVLFATITTWPKKLSNSRCHQCRIKSDVSAQILHNVTLFEHVVPSTQQRLALTLQNST